MTDDKGTRGPEGSESDPHSHTDPDWDVSSPASPESVVPQSQQDAEDGAWEEALSAPRRPSRGSRLEIMRAARRARRRRVMSRFWMVSIPVLVLLVIAIVLLSLYGGRDDGRPATDTTTTLANAAPDGSALLLVESEGSLWFAVLMQPWDSGGVVLSVPGITLFETDGAFNTLTATYEDEGADAVEAALSAAFDLPLGSLAVTDRNDLQAALATGGLSALPEQGSVTLQEEGEALALAVRELVSDYSPERESFAWTELELQGEEVSGLMQAVQLNAASMSDSVWTVSVLDGTLVEGDDFTYLEPDIDGARSLLVVSEQETIISVEVRDGAGVEGAARQVGSLLEAAGFTLAPMSYAEGYPGVQTTQVLVASVAMEDAARVVEAIGVGEVVEDASLNPDRIIVVLGKDFSVGASASTGGGE